jgi:ABC-type glutathione transport system ATPase component
MFKNSLKLKYKSMILKIFSNKMSIEEFSWNENSSSKNNNFLLPRSIRGLIVGKSGCGKTNLLLNLLLKDFLDYDNLQVFGKSLFQPEYKIIKTGFEQRLPKEILHQLFKNKEYIIGSGLSPQQLLQEEVRNILQKLQ